MGTSQDAISGSVQRSHDGATESRQSSGHDNRQLQERIAALQDEVTALRIAAQQRSALEDRLGQLLEANENLVLAAVHAQTLRDDAEAANRRQNEFLAMLAHELRNPLAPISMAAALLERVPHAPPQLLNLTRVIGRQVGHMAHLLDDLLDAARISSGKIMLAVEPIMLAEVIEQAVETVQPRIEERQQQLQVELPPGPIIADGDRVRLTQVFTNLLGNASKYTGDGGAIRLAVVVNDAEIAIAVEDSGAGMTAEIIPHIFDLFTQGPRSLARSEGGLGVGLNVVRNLVSMHRGTVRAESAGLGQGSRFTVRLPLSHARPAARAPQPDQARAAGPACRVLLIEDNVDACVTLQHFLALEGHTVSVAHDGHTGLQMAMGADYDAVICDIGLPGIDGFDVIRGLRKSGRAARPLMIALSGYCQAEDRARAIEAGFDHYFVKPISPGTLLALIASDECLARA
jgi:signal transduction histidine kinase/ActR/RegA family two-component response regulator